MEGREDLTLLGSQEVPCKDAISAGEAVGLVEPEADRVGADDDRAFREWERHHERGKTSANSSITLAGLGDCDRVVVKGYPGAGVDLDAGLIRKSQPMDLQPERLRRLSLSRLKGDVPGHRRSVYAQDFDRQDHALCGGIRESDGNLRRSQE